MADLTNDKPIGGEFMWRASGGAFIPMSEMSPTDLQNAYQYAESRVLTHWKKQSIFETLMTQLEQIAQARQVDLKSIDEAQIGTYLSNRRIHLNSLTINGTKNQDAKATS